jgi:hypothetical protein
LQQIGLPPGLSSHAFVPLGQHFATPLIPAQVSLLLQQSPAPGSQHVLPLWQHFLPHGFSPTSQGEHLPTRESMHFWPRGQQLMPHRVLPRGHFGQQVSLPRLPGSCRFRHSVFGGQQSSPHNCSFDLQMGRQTEPLQQVSFTAQQFPGGPQYGRPSGGQANGLSQRPLPVVVHLK